MIEVATIIKNIAEEDSRLLGKFPGGYHVGGSPRPDDMPHLNVNSFKLNQTASLNTGTVETYLVQIDIYAVGLAEAASLAAIVRNVFNRQAGQSNANGSGLVSMVYRNGDCMEDEDKSPSGDIVGHAFHEYEVQAFIQGV